MNIHEYQAKNLLLRYGIPIPPYAVVSTVDEVLQAIKELNLNTAVLKVQIHAGGRGKVGGVQFANDPEEIVKLAEQMIGKKIINQQTGPQGVIAQKLLISSTISIQKEYYLAATIDRSAALPIIIASNEGGMDIEEIAHSKPNRILKLPIQMDGKVRQYHLVELVKFMGWEGELKKEGAQLITNLAKAFMDSDGSLLEINPLVLTAEGHLNALDAKFSIDDNALYRQPGIAQWYDSSQYAPNEIMAREYDLAYVGLEGEIGCLVNGAGLAMATMDIIHHYGGAPANFLDVGGSATKEEIAQGFKIILLDTSIKSIFVNIFGGIMDCGVLAQGIVDASQKDQISVPLIIRMEGTNADIGKKIFKNSRLPIISVNTMNEGAIEAIKASRGEH